MIPRRNKPEKVAHIRKSEQHVHDRPRGMSSSEDPSTVTAVKATDTLPVASTTLVDEEDGSDSTLEDCIKAADSPDYSPSSGDESSDCTSAAEIPVTSVPLHKERKFIVFQSCLDEMFKVYGCAKCGTKDMQRRQREIGTMLLVVFRCTSCGTERSWTSQPYCGSTPAGNILLSTAIVCAGTTISKVERVLRHMSVASITKRTFHRHQREFISPQVEEVWLEQQRWLLAGLVASGNGLVLGGDGRADSPGHSAKFGTYTTMELKENIVVDVNIVQVNLTLKFSLAFPMNRVS